MELNKTASKPPPQAPKYDAWITAARDTLITTGIASVKIEHLARALNTKSSNFYHHFKNREELLHELLQHWTTNSIRTYEEVTNNREYEGAAGLSFTNNLWLEGKALDLKYELAVRDWGRNSETVTKAIKYCDKKRIKALEGIFLDLDYDTKNARVRAQVAYAYQIRHLTLEPGETTRTSRTDTPVLLEILLGK